MRIFRLSRADPEESLAKFETRARILAHLGHPGIPRFVGFFREDEGDDVACALVQDYDAGESLGQAVESGRRCTGEETAAWLAQALDVLAYLKRSSPMLTHGNIRPSNLILGADGRLCLTDFAFDGLPDGAAGDAVEIPPVPSGFTAPEVRNRLGSPAADVYALGMCGLYALSGRLPPYPSEGWPGNVIERVIAAPEPLKGRSASWSTTTR